MSRPQPPCVRLWAWLNANLGRGCLAPLTGTDSRALEAAVMILEAYSYDRSEENVQAFALVVSRMQASTRYFAFHAIAMVMDWSDRWALWHLAGLEEADVVGKLGCKNGPEVRNRRREAAAAQ